MTTQELSRPRYDQDFYAWALDQARRLREHARLRPNEAIDWELLADEVEDMGKSAQRAAEAFLKLAIGHLLKIDHAADAEALRHWAKELNAFRKNLRRALSDSLAAKLRRELAEIYEVARADAIAAMPRDPELEARTPETCPYSWEQITGDWLPERLAAEPPSPGADPAAARERHGSDAAESRFRDGAALGAGTPEAHVESVRVDRRASAEGRCPAAPRPPAKSPGRG